MQQELIELFFNTVEPDVIKVPMLELVGADDSDTWSLFQAFEKCRTKAILIIKLKFRRKRNRQYQGRKRKGRSYYVCMEFYRRTSPTNVSTNATSISTGNSAFHSRGRTWDCWVHSSTTIGAATSSIRRHEGSIVKSLDIVCLATKATVLPEISRNFSSLCTG